MAPRNAAVADAAKKVAAKNVRVAKRAAAAVSKVLVVKKDAVANRGAVESKAAAKKAAQDVNKVAVAKVVAVKEDAATVVAIRPRRPPKRVFARSTTAMRFST